MLDVSIELIMTVILTAIAATVFIVTWRQDAKRTANNQVDMVEQMRGIKHANEKTVDIITEQHLEQTKAIVEPLQEVAQNIKYVVDDLRDQRFADTLVKRTEKK